MKVKADIHDFPGIWQEPGPEELDLGRLFRQLQTDDPEHRAQTLDALAWHGQSAIPVLPRLYSMLQTERNRTCRASLEAAIEQIRPGYTGAERRARA